MSLSEHADATRFVSPEASAEPGRWDTSRVEYLRGPMDAISTPGVQDVVLMTSSQVGKTETILNVLNYFIDHEPCPILVIQPNEKPMGEEFSKNRLAPMIRDCPRLRKKISDAKGRDSNNTIMQKNFPGGHVSVVGANSPSSLSSRPVRLALFDEVDRYEKSAGSEGDPVDLGSQRTENFWNRKRIYVSTPGLKGLSRIENLYNSGDCRTLRVACPHCGHKHKLEWENVHYPADNPRAAVLKCPECGGEIDDVAKDDAIRNVGKEDWVAENPEGIYPSFHLNAFYSPWASIGDIAFEYEQRKDDPERLKTWTNLKLGLPYEDAGMTVKPETLHDRCEDWHGLPEGVLIITAGVDTQPDRLEMEVIGWGRGKESWSLDYQVFYGDPEIPDGHLDSPWSALSDYLRVTVFENEQGNTLKVNAVCIDSGGHNTQAVYHFCKGKRARRIFAIKGRGGEGIPSVSAPQRKKTGRERRPVDLYQVGVDQIKSTVYRALRKTEPGPNYCHFPAGRDAEFFEQLTAEKAVTRTRKGHSIRVWEKKEGVRNEALDCRVYGTAALILSAPKWDSLELRMREQLGKVAAPKKRKSPEPDQREPEPAADEEPKNKKVHKDPGKANLYPKRRLIRRKRHGNFNQR